MNKLVKKVTVILWLSVMTVLSAQEYQQNRMLMTSGGESAGGQYKLNGSIGQINTSLSEGDQYAIQAGYWQTNTDLIFENEFE